MKLKELVKLYAEQRDADLSTVKWLLVILRKFELHLGREAEIVDLTDSAVNGWSAAMLSDNKLARRTVHSYRRGLLILWRFALDENLTDRPVYKIRRIKLPKLIPRAWSQTEAESLLPQPKSLPGTYPCGIRKSSFWLALLLAIWDSGLRIGDLLRLKFSDFNASGVGCVVQKKTGWPKPFKFSHATMLAIAAIQTDGRQLVFGEIISRKTIYKTMRKLSKAAGLAGGTKKLRKSGATAVEMKRRGSATPYLGHQDQQMAYDFYVDPTLLNDSIQPPPLRFPEEPPEAA